MFFAVRLSRLSELLEINRRKEVKKTGSQPIGNLDRYAGRLKCAIIVAKSSLRRSRLQIDTMARVFGRGKTTFAGLKIAGINVHFSPRALRPARSIFFLHSLFVA